MRSGAEPFTCHQCGACAGLSLSGAPLATVFALQCAAVSRLGLLCADDKAALAHNLSRVGGEAVSVEALERCISKVRRPRPGMVALI